MVAQQEFMLDLVDVNDNAPLFSVSMIFQSYMGALYTYVQITWSPCLCFLIPHYDAKGGETLAIECPQIAVTLMEGVGGGA